MAVDAVGVTLGTSLGEGRYNSISAPSGGDPAAAIAAVEAAEVDVAAAVAVLVADGATPTQAHVTTLDAAHTVLAAAITSLVTVAGSANLTISVDTSVIDTRNKLHAAVAAALKFLESSSIQSG